MNPQGCEPYISYQEVEVQYSDLVYGLRGISLGIEQGEFVFFVGKSGAGKSTLLKLLTRQVKHTAGKIRFNKINLSTISPKRIPFLRREMGIIPQDFGLLPSKRVWENIGYAMRAVGMTRGQVRRRVPEILERVNIGYRADAYPHELSGGEQQRVAIGRALVNNPSILVADEPTANLDEANGIEIMALLSQLNLRGVTVLVSTHDMDHVSRFSKRVVTLSHGVVISDHVPASRSN